MTPNRTANISQFEECLNSETEDPTGLKDNYDKFKAYYKTLVNKYDFNKVFREIRIFWEI